MSCAGGNKQKLVNTLKGVSKDALKGYIFKRIDSTVEVLNKPREILFRHMLQFVSLLWNSSPQYVCYVLQAWMS